MKKTILFICSALWVLTAAAQDEDLNGRSTTSFYLKEATYKLKLINELTDSPTGYSYSARRGYVFRIAGQKDSVYIVQFNQFIKKRGKAKGDTVIQQIDKQINHLNQLSFFTSDTLVKRCLDDSICQLVNIRKDISNKNNNKATPVGYSTNGDFFMIEKKLLDSLKAPYIYYPKWTFTFGTVLIPGKFRFKVKSEPNSVFNFKTDIQLGLFLGVKFKPFKQNDITLSLLVGSGPTLVATDSITTKGFAKDNSTAGAYAISGGLVVEYKKAQLGIFCGADFASGELSKNWMYHKKPWLAIGLGFNIFSVGNKDVGKAKQTGSY